MRRDPTLPRDGEPKVLDPWSWLLGGRCAGHVGGLGNAAWLKVGEEGGLVSDPWPGLGAPVDPGYATMDPLR